MWTPAGWFPRRPGTYMFAGRFSAHHRVLIWDRRNCGASDVGIEDAESECHLWADDLHALLHELDMSPAYLGGSSLGCVVSLIVAHRYPQDVRGLILDSSHTDDVQDCGGPLAEHHYYCLARAAESGGMQAVIDLSTDPPDPDWAWITDWVAETIALNPENRERLLVMEPARFAAIMRQWARWLEDPRAYLARLSKGQLASIDVPALVSRGWNDWHPEHTARNLYRLLPNAQWADYAGRYTPEQVRARAEGNLGPAELWAFRFPFFKEFVQRVESGQFGGTR